MFIVKFFNFKTIILLPIDYEITILLCISGRDCTRSKREILYIRSRTIKNIIIIRGRRLSKWRETGKLILTFKSNFGGKISFDRVTRSNASSIENMYIKWICKIQVSVSLSMYMYVSMKRKQFFTKHRNQYWNCTLIIDIAKRNNIKNF